SSRTYNIRTSVECRAASQRNVWLGTGCDERPRRSPLRSVGASARWCCDPAVPGVVHSCAIGVTLLLCLVDSRTAHYGAYDLDVLDFFFVHCMGIVSQNHEIR